MTELVANNLILIMVLSALWTLPWKGIALWRAARNGDQGWFIVILIINTLAVIEILYIFFFSKKRGETSEQF
ncbi:MAG: hypothetical protein A2Z52_02745 [Candidatus Moranbacteria bacterium RBG_19FT_COMBO_42_6]|nr:MAG: hypothetical protein A2Z52_02745 [Candidatus Moranbacteria bacterium RBG_19FT_COMBO_42_6]